MVASRPSTNGSQARAEGWRDLAIHIVLTALEDAQEGDVGAYCSLQPGGFCYRLMGYLDVEREVVLKELPR